MTTSLQPAPAFGDVYRGKTVLVTGHTGFKGAWLAWWLLRLGARVIGYSQPAPTTPSLFELSGLSGELIHVEADIRDGARLRAAMAEHRPEVVFHLAAQPLVRASYREPVATFEINAMGTVHLLEAVRHVPSVKACVVVTTDKCYDNREWVHAYRENDPLGGHDPYSASKAAAELVTASYRASYFPPERGVGIATARAGNVIGGGDWAEDRLVPDSVRALVAGEPIHVRNPRAIRPWQHVLEPLAGYLWLGVKLLAAPTRFGEAWNFGPSGGRPMTVGEVVERVVAHWGTGSWRHDPASASDALHEANFLKLDVSKATAALGWEPITDFAQAIETTMAWYAAHHHDAAFDARAFTLAQIDAYVQAAAARQVAWAIEPPQSEQPLA